MQAREAPNHTTRQPSLNVQAQYRMVEIADVNTTYEDVNQNVTYAQDMIFLPSIYLTIYKH